jgi:peptide/nickel transport system substrate-binding protein
MRLPLGKYSLIDKLLGLIENQKTSDRLTLRLFFFITIFLGILFLYTVNRENSLETPSRGGILIEGIVGIPRFVNPALAITRADQDTVALVYSGLLKINENGDLIPDLAESINISEDGKTYHVTMRKDRKFHDGEPLTAKDAIYTMKLVQDPDLKSPLRGNWSDIIIKEINDYELEVVLNEAYSPFIENFTLGIMPQHIWSTLPIEQLPFSQHNTEPIGSGPFSLTNVNRDASGLISGYSLDPAPNGQNHPNLSAIELRFFPNETLLKNAFLNKEINSTAYLPAATIKELDKSNIRIITEPLPRVFGLFFNQNRSTALRDKSARQALNAAIDRERLIEEVLGGYGVPTDKPILEHIDALKSTSTEAENNSTFSEEAARKILIDGGWEKTEAGAWEKEIDKTTETLSLTIKTSNTDLFEKTITIIAENWRALGVEVQVEQYEQTGLVQSVIRPRDFQVLLFGLDMNRTQDLYPFWHSSQKDDPGLNITQYTNITVDRLLERTRNSQDKTARLELLTEVSNTLSEEVPAIFLFAPSIAYVVNEDIVTSKMRSLGKPSDRFMNVSSWYAKTEVVWPIFQKDDLVNDIN